jgi:hypothetical protein
MYGLNQLALMNGPAFIQHAGNTDEGANFLGGHQPVPSVLGTGRKWAATRQSSTSLDLIASIDHGSQLTLPGCVLMPVYEYAEYG